MDEPQTDRPSPQNQSSPVRWVALAGIIGAIISGYFFLGDSLTLESLAEQENRLRAFQFRHPLLVYALAFGIYVAVTGLSLPGAAVMSLAMAWFFRFWPALILVSFASTAGATIAFLSSRYFLRDAIVSKFGSRLESFNENLRREGAFYLFSLRLIVGVPFFVINVVMGLTPIRTRTFWWVSQLGMLPGTAAYVYAGSSVPDFQTLAERGAAGILSPQLIVAFILLGLVPLAGKKSVQWFRGRSLMVLLAVCFVGCGHSDRPKPLVVHCAAVMRSPVQAIASQYQQETGTPIELQFGGSNTLLAQIKIGRIGDIYIPADASYIDQARAMELVASDRSLTQIWPVILVRPGYSVDGVDDLLASGARIAIADPEAAAIGRTVKRIFQSEGRWETLKTRIRNNGVTMPTVSAVAGAVQIGSVDVGIVWNSVASAVVGNNDANDNDGGCAVIEVPAWRSEISSVRVVTLTTAVDGEAASKFATFLVSDATSRDLLNRSGFSSP